MLQHPCFLERPLWTCWKHVTLHELYFSRGKKTEFADKSPHDIEKSDLGFLVNQGFLDLFNTFFSHCNTEESGCDFLVDSGFLEVPSTVDNSATGKMPVYVYNFLHVIYEGPTPTKCLGHDSSTSCVFKRCRKNQKESEIIPYSDLFSIERCVLKIQYTQQFRKCISDFSWLEFRMATIAWDGWKCCWVRTQIQKKRISWSGECGRNWATFEEIERPYYGKIAL